MNHVDITGNQRQDKLINLINERGYVSIEQLSMLLEISTQTVRRDIKKLSQEGYVTRHHGGAGRISSVFNTNFSQREVSRVAEKQAIARTIAERLPDRCTLFLSIGTTAECIARALDIRRDLRIITNSLRVAHILYPRKDFDVMVPGGTIRDHNSGIIGPSALAFVNSFRADYLIASLGAIDRDGALLDFDINEVAMIQAMMTHSRNVWLAADHSKFYASAAVQIGNTAQLSALFCDSAPPEPLNALLKQQNVEQFISPIAMPSHQ